VSAGRVRSRRFFVPEVVQTSGMDCGPAALTALLNGCRVPVSYARLREACHTDVDGTSIDTLEQIARQLGFPAEQIMVPLDHVLLAEAAALPAVVAIRNPAGAVHFVVVWRCHGPFVQVMDPARGRLWMRRSDLLRLIYAHTTVVPAAAWREWAGSAAFLHPLRKRLRRLGISRQQQEAEIARAIGDSSWRRLAALDASTRMLAALRATRTLRPSDVRAALSTLVDNASHGSASLVPADYWSVRPADADPATTSRLRMRGAVLVRGRGPQSATAAQPASADLAAAVIEPPPRPFRALLAAAREDGLLAPAIAALATIVAAGGVVFEAILLRSVLDVSRFLRLHEQQLMAGFALAAFVAILLGLELLLGNAERRIGSHLEARLRMTFLTKIPQLADSYFQTRPIADMLERSHSVHILRTLPRLGIRGLRAALELVITAFAVAWLAPGMAGVALALAASAAAIPLLGQSLVSERDLRVRTHAGALARFHLDALLGRTAIEAHSAARTVEREHERLLGEWGRASVALLRSTVTIEGWQTLVAFGLAAWLLFGHLAGGDVAGSLLVAYWVMNLPALGYELALCAREYPACRSILLRLLEPLGAQWEAGPAEAGLYDRADGLSAGRTTSPAAAGPCQEQQPVDGETAARRLQTSVGPAGVSVACQGVSVAAGGHRILGGIDLEIEPGSHVAIVGSSGAGKSTLTGLLLGWHRPADGELLIDGAPLTPERLEALRQETAWVDPTVQIWNRPLIDNLVYGSGIPPSIAPILEAADLHQLLSRLPDGLATPLGENGSLLSTGEAQRVRLGRAMLRQSARLVLLDEPFSGLENDRRRKLLAVARRHWSGSTLLYVTHDVTEACSFDRVLVLERGRIVEDGDPDVLASTPSSRFAALLEAQHRVAARFDSSGGWRRVRLERGRIIDDHSHATLEQAV
jgi:ATP-binding cassette subfamily B protein